MSRMPSWMNASPVASSGLPSWMNATPFQPEVEFDRRAAYDPDLYNSMSRAEQESFNNWYNGLSDAGKDYAKADPQTRKTMNKQLAADLRATNDALAATQSVPGQVLMGVQQVPIIGQALNRAAQGALDTVSAAQSLTARATGLASEAMGRSSAPAKTMIEQINRDNQAREKFLQLIEEGEQTNEILGDRGSRIFNSVARSVPKIAGIASSAGGAAVLATVTGESFDQALHDADAQGIENRLAYAGSKAAIEGGVTAVFGAVGKAMGVRTLEESLTPGGRNAISWFLRKSGMERKLADLAKYTKFPGSGLTAEAAEEGVVTALQQVVDKVATGKEFDGGEIFEAAVAGALGAGAVKSAVGFNRAKAEFKNYFSKDRVEQTVTAIASAENFTKQLTMFEDMKAEGKLPEVKADAEPDQRKAEIERAQLAVRQAVLGGVEAVNADIKNPLTQITLPFEEDFELSSEELLSKLTSGKKPIGQAEFEKLTGIKKSSQLFRETFVETLRGSVSTQQEQRQQGLEFQQEQEAPASGLWYDGYTPLNRVAESPFRFSKTEAKPAAQQQETVVSGETTKKGGKRGGKRGKKLDASYEAPINDTKFLTRGDDDIIDEAAAATEKAVAEKAATSQPAIAGKVTRKERAAARAKMEAEATGKTMADVAREAAKRRYADFDDYDRELLSRPRLGPAQFGRITDLQGASKEYRKAFMEQIQAMRSADLQERRAKNPWPEQENKFPATGQELTEDEVDFFYDHVGRANRQTDSDGNVKILSMHPATEALYNVIDRLSNRFPPNSKRFAWTRAAREAIENGKASARANGQADDPRAEAFWATQTLRLGAPKLYNQMIDDIRLDPELADLADQIGLAKAMVDEQIGAFGSDEYGDAGIDPEARKLRKERQAARLQKRAENRAKKAAQAPQPTAEGVTEEPQGNTEDVTVQEDVPVADDDLGFLDDMSEDFEGEEAEAERLLSGESGALRFSPAQVASVAENARVVSERAKLWIKENFRAAGLRNEALDRLNSKRMGSVAEQVKRSEFLAADLEDALGRAYGGRLKMTKAQLADVDAALKGLPNHQPIEVMEALVPLRQHINQLSRTLIDLGVIDEAQHLALEERDGMYITRNYQKFDDKNWMKRVKSNEDLMRRARGWLASEYPQDTPMQREWRLNALIDQDSAAARDDNFPGGNLDGKFMDLLKTRKDLPGVVRELFGEYRDPFVNYTNSVAKMARLVSEKQFSQQAAQIGLAQGWLATPDTARPDQMREISARNHPNLSELSGLYATPEIAMALNDIMDPKMEANWYRTAVKLSGIAKEAKTVWSIGTHFVNFLGNPMFALAGGDLNGGAISNAGQIARTVKTMMTDRGDAGTRKFIEKLTKLRVLDGSLTVGEIQSYSDSMGKLWGDQSLAADDPWFGAKSLKRGFDVVRDKLQRAYQAEDAIWKINGFMQKQKYYARLNPTATQDQIDQMAADDVIAHYPTYHRANKATRAISRFPLIADFATFQSEMVRTTKNAVTTSLREMQSNNPIEREMGQKRMIGLIGGSLAIPAMSAISQAVAGVSDEEEEALRKFVAPWSERGFFFFLGRGEDGSYKIQDLSRFDPRSMLTKMGGALSRGDAAGMLEELNNPFGESILFGKLASWWRNRNPEGTTVYDEDTDLQRQTAQTLKHFAEAFSPGTVDQLGRIGKAIAGETSRGGKDYKVGQELLATFGARSETVDVRQAMEFRNGDMTKRIRNLEKGAMREAMSRGTAKLGIIMGELEAFNSYRDKAIMEWHDLYKAATVLGMPTSEIGRHISDTAGKEVAREVISGRPQVYAPSANAVQTIRERQASARDGVDRIGAMREVITELRRKKQERLQNEAQ